MRRRGFQDANKLFYLLDSAELVRGFFIADGVRHKSTFRVEEHAKVFLRFFDGDDIHEASWIAVVCANLVVDFYQPLHDDHHHLSVRQGVLQAVTQKHDQWNALSKLVRT